MMQGSPRKPERLMNSTTLCKTHHNSLYNGPIVSTHFLCNKYIILIIVYVYMQYPISECVFFFNSL